MTADLLGVDIERQGSRGVLRYTAEGQTFSSLREATIWIRDRRAEQALDGHRDRSAS